MITTLANALRGVALRDELGDGDRFVLEQAAEALERAGGSPIPPFKLCNETTQEGAHYLCRAKHAQNAADKATLEKVSDADAALDAEADALRVEGGGIFSWGDMGKGVQNDWRAVALKAREMHRRKASMKECAYVYMNCVGTQSERLRFVLEHLGVEVTP